MNVGDIGEATRLVEVGDTAKNVLVLSAGDEFPEVFATARMIALMEIAASRPLNALLQPGQLSVGVGVDVKHVAATPVGVEVRAVATYLGMEGKLYRFKVEAFDPGGLIGEGEHTRAIITSERLIRGALNRNQK